MQRLLLWMANSLKCIGVAYVVSITTSALIFTMLEDYTFAEGVWWSCATALTIGYGDIAPVTWPMRVVGLIFSHFWIMVLIPIVIANIIVKAIQARDKVQESIIQMLRQIIQLLEERK